MDDLAAAAAASRRSDYQLINQMPSTRITFVNYLAAAAAAAATAAPRS
jgi:hypothetical protein